MNIPKILLILTRIPFKILQNSGIPQHFESAEYGILHKLPLYFLEILKRLGTPLTVVHGGGGGGGGIFYGIAHYTLIVKLIDTAAEIFLVSLPVNYCYMLHRVVLHSSGILQSTYSMKTYVLSHFEHKLMSQSLPNFRELLSCGS